MDAQSDKVAADVAGNARGSEAPQPAVLLCGYLRVTEQAAVLLNDDGTPDLDANGHPQVDPIKEARLYTTSSFDQWIVIPLDVRAQLPDRSEDQGRSLVWLDADAPVTQCRLSKAIDVAQTLSSGMDDPTALPRGPKN